MQFYTEQHSKNVIIKVGQYQILVRMWNTTKTLIHSLWPCKLMWHTVYAVGWMCTVDLAVLELCFIYLCIYFGCPIAHGSSPEPGIRSEPKLQHGILNPRGWARDWTFVPVLLGCHQSLCAPAEAPGFNYLINTHLLTVVQRPPSAPNLKFPATWTSAT